MEDWITIFENDLSSKVFSKPGTSNEILYWIKRFPNGKRHEPSSTFNSYALRSFEIYNSQLLATTMIYEGDHKWECTGVNEGGLDAFGSYCSCYIKDELGKELNINVHGQIRSSSGYQHALKQHLYFSAIIFLLRYLSKYRTWTDVEENDKSITKGEGLPMTIFEKVERRDNYLRDFNI